MRGMFGSDPVLVFQEFSYDPVLPESGAEAAAPKPTGAQDGMGRYTFMTCAAVKLRICLSFFVKTVVPSQSFFSSTSSWRQSVSGHVPCEG